jgi:molybdate transport system regulatory protein
MNQLIAKIQRIEKSGTIILVSLLCEGMRFTSLIIDNEDEYLEEGNSVFMIFKAAEVFIAKNYEGGLSIRNRFPCTITQLEKGRILTQVTLDFKGNTIISVLTTDECEALHLDVNDKVEGLLKTNELMLMKVI